jgi:ABC-type uncharacterized transport system involved in gliding motility auxiliary subunit
VLGELKEEVKVTAFYGSKEPGYEPVRSVLDMYRYASNRFVYEFVDPVVRDDLVEKYKITVGGPRLLLSYQGKEERVKLESEEQSGPEEAITAALLKLTATGERHKVCFTTGHGERALQGEDPQQVASLMVQDLKSEGYLSDSLSLLDQPQVPQTCQVVVLLGPRQDLIAGEIDSLRKYLAGGGRLLAFLGPGDTASLNPLLLTYGVLLGPDTVVNPKSRSALEVVTDPMRYPQTHPIFSHFFRGGMVVLNQLQAVFPVARAVRKASGEGFNVTELAFSNPQAWSETDNLDAVETVAFDEGKDLAGPVSLAVVVEGKPAAEVPPAPSQPASAPVGARLAVFGSSLFPVDAAYRIFPFNRNLTMNTLAWLAAEEKKITIRPRFRAASLLRLDESQMKFITFFSLDILPLLILAFGITVWQIRRWS